MHRHLHGLISRFSVVYQVPVMASSRLLEPAKPSSDSIHKTLETSRTVHVAHHKLRNGDVGLSSTADIYHGA
jgi:hypothetical protein